MIPGQVAVVVPARDEEDWLPACLAALDTARVRLLRTVPRVLVSVTVVLDRCTDGSERVARRAPGVSVISGSFGSVGAARDVGVRFALARSRCLPARTWIANTDADTLVPRDWLVGHHGLGSRHDLVLGTVRPTLTADNAERMQRWSDAYTPRDGHPHVHGANLGIRGSTYGEVGGFGALEQDEDVDLVRRARGAGVDWTASGALEVTTSSRTVGRVPAGFSTYLGRIV
ncbi:mycofactocin system glycosyltransferase [Arthrobacter agilis]|uniref:glycosyltransferase n=1 Tax=Arthrobacter agilis TaxID=37921 RepID=UPI000F6DC822|nr:glycosyltransferase [Arthrobacter agilis]VDR31343.1 mycofactocin system glycosyltransferase [Arthrobacter agilis]